MRHHYTLLVLFTLSSISKSQRPSPCPQTFHYESQNREEDNKWYGSITLSTNEDLFGIWVKILLDHKAELLGNWFGASTSSDNKEFTIKSTNYHLKAGSPVQVRFYVQYDVNQPVPSVSSIKLNGKYICNVSESQTNNNKPNTRPNSNSRPTNTKPQQQNSGNSNTQSQHRPLNVDANSFNKDQNDYNPAFGNSKPNANKPSNTQSNTRPQNSVSNTRPSSQSSNSNTRPNYNDYDSVSTGGTNRPVQSSNTNSRPSYSEYDTVSGTSNRPVQSSNTNSRPSYNEYDTGSGNSNRPVQSSNTNSRPGYNEYDTGSGNSNRPAQSSNTNTRPTYQNEYDTSSSGSNSRPVSGSNVNRPLNVDVDSYGTNQNEFAPAFANVADNNNNPYNNQGSNNRLPTDNYNTNRPITSTNTIQRPSHNTNSDTDFFPGDVSITQSVTKPETARPAVLNQKPACGTVFAQPTPLITHGLQSNEGQYPWHVALYHSQGIQLTYICGGSLISEDYVVTAAHCVTSPSTGRPNNPQNILIYLGKTNLKKFGTEVQDREVSKILVHRDYNHTVFHNDIALLKLGHPADITNYVRPVCLWEGGTDLNSVLDQLGTVVGWGFDENGQLTTSLMQTKMPVVSSIKCVYSNPDFFSRFTFDKSYCAGFRNGTTVCNGDSGGGMIFPKMKRNGEVQSWHLRGLVSVGVALQGKTSCDPSHYIVFTDVAKHLDWIRNNINNYY